MSEQQLDTIMQLGISRLREHVMSDETYYKAFKESVKSAINEFHGDSIDEMADFITKRVFDIDKN